MKKVSIALLLLSVVVFTSSCGIGSRLAEAISEELATVAVTPLPTPASTPTPALPDENVANDEDFRRVGSENFGFISIPSYWADFVDIGSIETETDIDAYTGIIQFSDRSGQYIITMQYFSTDGLAITAEDFINIMGANIEDTGGLIFEVIPDALLNGINALVIMGYFRDDGTVVFSWVLEDTSEMLRHIMIEGPLLGENFMDVQDYVQLTFSLSH